MLQHLHSLLKSYAQQTQQVQLLPLPAHLSRYLMSVQLMHRQLAGSHALIRALVKADKPNSNPASCRTPVQVLDVSA
jgi:hypothetical protein